MYAYIYIYIYIYNDCNVMYECSENVIFSSMKTEGRACTWFWFKHRYFSKRTKSIL